MAKSNTIEAILSIKPDVINGMTANELRPLVAKLASAANKRLKRLEASEIGQQSPAYKSAMKRSYTTTQGGKFGTKGKDKGQLSNEFKALREFFGKKTSSVTGFSSYRKKVYEKLGNGKGFDNVDREKEFWSMYRKIEELHPEMKYMQYGSVQAQADLMKVVQNDARAIIREVNKNNVSFKRKDRDKYIEKITNDYYVLNEKHRRVKIDPKDNDDILYLMSLRVGAAYEQQQRDYSGSPDNEFITI